MTLYRGRFLRYVEVAESAENFLKQYNPQRLIPVPIEQIVDQKLNVYIVPESGLWDRYEISGWSSLDQSRIYIDTDIYMRHEQWSRFTIAHEVGHFHLHHSLLRKETINTPEEWKQLVMEQQEDQIDFEWQADAFAGCALVPTKELAALVTDCLDKAKTIFNKVGHAWDEELAIQNMSPEVSRHFNISQAAAATRVNHWYSKQYKH